MYLCPRLQEIQNQIRSKKIKEFQAMEEIQIDGAFF